MFEETLALLTERAAAAPVLLVLEDLHWADTSTLDLVVFLAHNLDDRRGPAARDLPRRRARVGRAHAPARRRRPALGLGARARARTARARGAGGAARGARRRSPPAALTDAIVARSEGNPFFAEELLAAAGDRSGELPRGLRDLLLQRVARLDRATQSLLRLAAAAGRDVGYPLLRAVAALPERDVRESLRQAVEHGVLVADQATGSFRFRHALLAEAIYATILPGEREELHARLADELARSGAAAPAELAPHWAAAGRSAEALAASVEAAREAEAVFGLAEALAHLERALALWDAVPDAAELAGLDLAELCSWAAELASQTGAAPRAVELARRAIELVGDERPAARGAPARAPRPLPARERQRATPASPRSSARSSSCRRSRRRRSARRRWRRSRTGLMLAWRYDESLRGLRAGARARARGRRARGGAPGAHGARQRPRLPRPRRRGPRAALGRPCELAEEIGDPVGLERAYVNLTDVLTMLGRPRESARLAEDGARRRCAGTGSTAPLLVANRIEALLAIGEWDEADSAQRRRAPRDHRQLSRTCCSSSAPTSRSAAATSTPRGRTSRPRAPPCARTAAWRSTTRYLAELALWERRWTDADEAVRDGLARARSRRPRRSASGSAPRDCARRRSWRRSRAPAGTPTPSATGSASARKLLADRSRAPPREAAAVTPNAGGWLALAEAEYERARGAARPEPWSDAAATWERLERPPLAAYCRWRQAEALVAAGASRAEASVPLREAHAVAARIGARPLLRELELLAERARLDLAPPRRRGPPDAKQGLDEILGLTPREAEVLDARRPRLHQPRDRRRRSSSASRPRASTSRTSCASSTRRTGSRRPRSRTASPLDSVSSAAEIRGARR